MVWKETQLDLIDSWGGDEPVLSPDEGLVIDDVPVIGRETRADYIYIPFMAPSTNQIYAGVHWRKRQTQAELGHAAVADIALAPYKRPVCLTFIPLIGKGGRARDCSNYSYTAKLIEDGLVKAGILQDDSPAHVKGFEIVEPHIDRTQDSGMWVYIEEVGEAHRPRWLKNGCRYPWEG